MSNNSAHQIKVGAKSCKKEGVRMNNKDKDDDKRKYSAEMGPSGRETNNANHQSSFSIHSRPSTTSYPSDALGAAQYSFEYKMSVPENKLSDTKGFEIQKKDYAQPITVSSSDDNKITIENAKSSSSFVNHSQYAHVITSGAMDEAQQEFEHKMNTPVYKPPQYNTTEKQIIDSSQPSDLFPQSATVSSNAQSDYKPLVDVSGTNKFVENKPQSSNSQSIQSISSGSLSSSLKSSGNTKSDYKPSIDISGANKYVERSNSIKSQPVQPTHLTGTLGEAQQSFDHKMNTPVNRDKQGLQKMGLESAINSIYKQSRVNAVYAQVNEDSNGTKTSIELAGTQKSKPASASSVLQNDTLSFSEEPYQVASTLSGVNGNLNAAQAMHDIKMNTPVFAVGQQSGITTMIANGSTVGGKGVAYNDDGSDAPETLIAAIAAQHNANTSSKNIPTASNTPSNKQNANTGSDYTKIRYTHGNRAEIAKMEGAVLRAGAIMFARTVTRNSAEAGQGAHQVADMGKFAYSTVGVSTIKLARIAVNAPLKAELTSMLATYGVSNTTDLVKKLNVELVANGMKALPKNARGSALNIMAARQLRRLKRVGGTPKSVINAYKELQRVGLLTTFAGKNVPLRVKISKRIIKTTGKMAKYGRRYGGEAGEGFALVLSTSQQALRTVKTSVKTIQFSSRIGLIVTRKAANTAARGVLASLKTSSKLATKAGAKENAKSLNNTVGKLESMAQKHAAKRAERGVKKQSKLARKKPSLVSRLKGKIKNKAKGAMRKAWGRIVKHVPGLRHVSNSFKTFGKASRMFSKALGKVAAAIGKLMQTLALVLGAFLIFCIICTLLTMVFNNFLGAFDFTNSAEDQQSKVINAVEKAYQDDMDAIVDLSNDYESFTISYEYDKDSSKYQEIQEKADSDQFLQTSNCAEVLSMTLVKYGYNLASGDRDLEPETGSGTPPDLAIGDNDTLDDENLNVNSEIITESAEKYAERLYHGSHQIEVQEMIWYDYDDEGNVIAEHKTANAVYRTYGFDSIFQCTEADTTPIIYGTIGGDGSLSGASNVDEIYAYLRDQGFTHAGACGIMGNLQQESNFNPTCSTGSYHGIEQIGFERWAACQAYCSTNGLDYNSIAGQISYLVYELTSSSSKGSIGKRSTLVSILQSTDDVQKAAETFCVGVERCVYGSDAYHYKAEYWPYSSGTTYLYQQMTKRVNYAQNLANKYAAYKDDWSSISAPTTTDGGGASDIVSYAESWVGSGIPYQSGGPGGRGLTLEQCKSSGKGTDCSGFVSAVFAHYGIKVPTASSGPWASAKKVSDSSKQPGDIIVWSGHVAIYIGNKTVGGKTYDIVHMSNPTTKICYGTIATAKGGAPYTVYRYAPQITAGVLSGKWDLQTNYTPKSKYIYDNPGGSRTVYDAACGPTSLANVVRNLLGVNVTTLQMCQYSVSVGARASSGTDMNTLISKASKKWNFSYKYVTSAQQVYNHCKSDGMAIAHTPGVQPFSSGGHFMAVVGVQGSNVILIDPYYYSSKRSKYSKAGCTVTSTNGMYYVPVRVLSNGCDRFYLISKK